MPKLKVKKTLVWTTHARFKMRFYRLSEQMIKGVMHSPKRIEKGIAPDTVAFCKQSGSGKKPHEIWVMVAEDAKHRRVVSAWRYPGLTKSGDALPEEIVREMKSFL